MQPSGNPAFTMTFLNPRPESVELIDQRLRMAQERLKQVALNLTHPLASNSAKTLSLALRILACSCSLVAIIPTSWT